MIAQILAGTPLWVWAMLVLLVALGLTQSRTRTVTLRRVVLLPLAMTGLSMFGTYSAFHASPWSWVLWAGAALATLTWFASADHPAGMRYEAAQRHFHMPGSWEPMALMMAIFGTRYGVAVTLSLHPEWAQEVAVAAIIASIYGALSGVFMGRMLRMILATRPSASPAAADATMAWG
ncbi:MAG: DUF6622 family protein [Burkholderiaceae bacterium]